METTLIKSADIAVKFALASKLKDLDILRSLLSDTGEFQIQDNELESITVNKDEFIDWFAQKLEHTTIDKIEYDHCIHCSFGSPVVLFNGGSFPRVIKDSSERSKTGLMLEFIDGKISTLKFCYVFANNDNKYVFECNIEKMNEYQKQGYSYIEAYNKAIE